MGGSTKGKCGVLGCGTVFKVAPDGTATVLHKFQVSDGRNPASTLVLDGAGNLYGTTIYGGANNNGTVYKIAPDGTETVRYSFGGSGGIYPQGSLAQDGSGDLYGTTADGGDGYGVVFKISPSGAETVLYAFGGGVGGAYPEGGVILDGEGNLYGTTSKGGAAGNGTVFKVAPDGKETILYAFKGDGENDGALPWAPLAMDGSGDLYGTTTGGGTGGGTVFRVTPDGKEKVLYSFEGAGNGYYPLAGVSIDASGNLFGTTQFGGNNCKNHGCGVAYEVTAKGKAKTFFAFRGQAGHYPDGGVIVGADGGLYGTTALGGANGGGTVFELKPKK
jgi:uncharacterized repeat protein (TIGR03803 family)